MGAQTAKTSPPSGTGHVPGFGESFNINLNSGQGVYSYKISLPEGRAKHTPSLTLEYSSSHQYGNFGWGWKIDTRTIGRKLDTDPSGEIEEVFMDSGQEILPMPDGNYHCRFESQFNRYERKDEGWIIRERNGSTHELGMKASGRIADPDHPDRVFRWLLEKSSDSCGNEIHYRYQILDHTHYLDSIDYAIYRVKFNYESRPDIRTHGRMGFLAKTSQRCSQIELKVKINEAYVTQKRWKLVYAEEPTSRISLLKAIQLTAIGSAEDQSDQIEMPLVNLHYQDFDPHTRNFNFINTEGYSSPPPLWDDEVSLIRMDNNPLPGILSNQNGRQVYWGNDGNGNFIPARPISKVPFVSSFASEGSIFCDMDASGNADMMVLGPNGLNGYYENKGDLKWSNFVAYPKQKRSFPTAKESTRFVDLNGNGVVDAISSTKRSFHVYKNQRNQGWDAPAVIGKTAEGLGEVELDDLHYHLADMTGDGLMDIVRIDSGKIEYWPSLGKGKYGVRTIMFRAPRISRLKEHLDKCFFADLNGSGCADLVIYDGTKFQVCYNQNGLEWADPIHFGLLPAPVEGTMRPVDFYGNGKTGILYNTWTHAGPVYAYVTFGSHETGFNLTKVDNGFGLESEIFYKPAIHYYKLDYHLGNKWETHFPFPLQVVSGMKEKDVITGLVCESEVVYHNAHFNSAMRQFQGFSLVEKIDKGDESCPDKKTVNHYLMAQEFQSGQHASHAALNGKLSRVEIFALDGSEKENTPYTIEESVYHLSKLEPSSGGMERVAVQLKSYIQTHMERSLDRRVEKKDYEYDSHGNVRVEKIHASGTKGDKAMEEITSEIHYEYAINMDQWILDKVSKATVLDDQGTVVGETHRYYDGDDYIGLPLGKVEKGLEVRESRLLMQKADFKAHYQDMEMGPLGYFEQKDHSGEPAIFLNYKRSKYDAQGLRIGEMDAMGNSVDIVFDSTGLFREKYISALGENNYEIDHRLALVTKITGPEGSVLRMSHDAMGRLIQVFSPDNDSAIPSRTYEFDNSKFPFKRITKFYDADNMDSFSKVITYFDGASNEIQNRFLSGPEQFAVSEYKVKNPLGKVKIEHQPYFSSSEEFDIPDPAKNPHQLYFFDGMDRPIRTVNFLGGVSTADYNVFEVITSDPLDNSSDPEMEAAGLTKTPKVERFNVLRDRTETIQKIENGEETRLVYQLSSWGQLEAISDDHGILSSYVYDYQGNRLLVNHREAGERKVWYNALKQPVRGQDAKNNVITGEYDMLNRISRLMANDVEVEKYTYDEAANNAIGRLSQVEFLKGKQIFSYDLNGQIIQKRYDFKDRPDPISIKFSYDRLGRRKEIEQDDGTKISYSYTPNGWVKSIEGLIKSIDYDPMGNPSLVKFDNGVETQYNFFPGGRKIKAQKTSNKNQQVLEDLEYEYLPDGSLLRYLDKTTNQTLTHDYQYNGLGELTSYNTAQGDITEAHGYEYEDHLNLRTLGDNGSTMFREDASKPARISKIKDKEGHETLIQYDQNGNLLNLSGRSFTYDYKNCLGRMEHENGTVAEYFYNHREERIQKNVTEGQLSSTTFFIGNMAEYKNSQKAYFVYLGNIRVAMILNGVKNWIHCNYLGNTNFYTDDKGTKIASIGYKPFGNISKTDNKIPAHTFGTHPYDEESGLYYANKRYYAPEIGCFLTADPVALFLPKKIIGSIKAFQCYAYTGNDPANNVDLTGLSFWSVFGAIVGAIVGVALVVFAGPLAALILGIGIITLSYVLASNNVNNDFGEFMRGFMIGFNAGMNAAIGTILFGPVIGIALGVINFLAAFDSIASNEIYKGILGWSSWMMPMSWVVNGLGLIFVVINLIVAGITFQQVERVKIHSISVNWQMGMIVMEGGLITYPPGGFNMGNFTFLGQGQTGIVDHELGHGLNLGAFGWVFHFVGAIDENAVQTNMHDAYSEHLAESNQATPDHAPPSPSLDMWT